MDGRVSPGDGPWRGCCGRRSTRSCPSWSGLAVAGRTDAGVHATGQVASLEAAGGPPVDRLAEALNTVLPDDLAVVAAADAPDGFHARFSARAQARIATSWWRAAYGRPCGLGGRSGGRGPSICGRSRPARQPSPGSTTSPRSRRRRRGTRSSPATIRAAAWERRDDELHFTVTADSFLRHMVRTLVGTMLETSPSGSARLLEGRPRVGGRHDRAALGPVPRARRATSRRCPTGRQDGARGAVDRRRAHPPSSSSISTAP